MSLKFKPSLALALALAFFGLLISSQICAGQQQHSTKKQPPKSQQQQQQQQQVPDASETAAKRPYQSGAQKSLKSPVEQRRRLASSTTSAPLPNFGANEQSTDNYDNSQQQQQQSSSDNNNSNNSNNNSDVYGSHKHAASTDDPLADSEPAVYGSVAGKPGVDFPAYASVPKTSFSCQDKLSAPLGFGFFADEEAQCQVYHICWEGRRESFLCGVGTVFNQAILACDYWHSVDCSKSSQFYASSNSELGKSNAEPSGGRQQAQGSSSSSLATSSFGGRTATKAAQQPQQPQRPATNFDASEPSYRNSQQQASADADDEKPQAQPQHAKQRPLLPAKGRPADKPTLIKPPTPTKSTKQRKVFNNNLSLDLNQKLNSLIESPVRPPLVQSHIDIQTHPAPVAAAKESFASQPPPPPVRSPIKSMQIRHHQIQYQTPARVQPGANRIVQQRQQKYEPSEPTSQADIGQDSPVGVQASSSASFEPVSQSQATTFDDSPQAPSLNQIPANNNNNNKIDDSSAIISQFDVLSPPANSHSNANNADKANSGTFKPRQQQQQQLQTSYDSTSANADDDFRVSGAKAAASDNQNWYIMRAI